MLGMPIRWAYYCIFRAANAPDLGFRQTKRRAVPRYRELDGHDHPMLGAAEQPSVAI